MKIPLLPPVGHVVAYEYLWRSQSGMRDDGAKTYPTALILARHDQGPAPLVYALGISHKPPQLQERALALPLKLKRWLGLDDDPSWIYTDQLNIFVWPGPDLRPAHQLTKRRDAGDGCVIGPLPQDWFDLVKLHVRDSRRLGKLAALKRGE